MPTTLTCQKLLLRSAQMNGESSIPPLRQYTDKGHYGKSQLSEEEGLFVDYGRVPSPFPYKMQDRYTEELYELPYDAVILENEHLKATFLPGLGGKLMSLIDLDRGRELLYRNPVVRPRNLALRNAWTAGGIEFNCGVLGHGAYTCDQIFTAKTALSDGTPVLRMYEYERIRKCVYQMDFFLPEGAKVLFARMRVVNPQSEVIPMYWWTNIGVPEWKGGRVIVDADSAYVATPDIHLAPLPYHDGNEVTYPENIPISMDYFYKIPDKSRKYECYIDSEGHGFLHTSTARLQGRKLFVWGQGPGGDRWQEYLTEGNPGRYVELQAGLAHSQYEYIPMPCNCAWEWLEAYGAITLDKDLAHGPWQQAKEHTRATIDLIITDERMDEILESTKGMAAAPADELLLAGSGWAALENMSREKVGLAPMTPHLDFGTLGPAQADWSTLLATGNMPEKAPDEPVESFMLDARFTVLLEKAVQNGSADNWYAHMQLGMSYFASGRMEEAHREFTASNALSANALSLYGLAQIARYRNDAASFGALIMRASKMDLDNVSLACEAMGTLSSLGWNEELNFLYSLYPESIRALGRVKLLVIPALIKTGRLDEASALLYADGGLVVPDIREGEKSLTALWFDLEEAKAKKNGLPFDRTTAKPPVMFDFRMDAQKQ